MMRNWLILKIAETHVWKYLLLIAHFGRKMMLCGPESIKWMGKLHGEPWFHPRPYIWSQDGANLMKPHGDPSTIGRSRAGCPPKEWLGPWRIFERIPWNVGKNHANRKNAPKPACFLSNTHCWRSNTEFSVALSNPKASGSQTRLSLILLQIFPFPNLNLSRNTSKCQGSSSFSPWKIGKIATVGVSTIPSRRGTSGWVEKRITPMGINEKSRKPLTTGLLRGEMVRVCA